MNSTRQALIGGALLALFGVLGALLVSVTHEATSDRIAMNERDALLRQIRLLIPMDQIDNDPLTDTLMLHAKDDLGSEQVTVYRARKGNAPVALVLSPVAAKGYAGDIRLILAITADGTLSGVRVLSHRETPGLGDKIEETRSDWILGFKGRSLEDPVKDKWKVKRDGGDFDQFTGATITPRSIVKAVHKALVYVDKHQKQLYAVTETENSNAK